MSDPKREHSLGRRKMRAFDGWLIMRVCHLGKGTGSALAKENRNYTGKLINVPFSPLRHLSLPNIVRV